MVNKNTEKYRRIKTFAEDASIKINNILSFDDANNPDKETYDFYDGEYHWHVYKHYLNCYDYEPLLEINISRQNYKKLNEQIKGNRIYEKSFVYLKNANKNSDGVDASIKNGIILDNLSFQDYRYCKE